jgi:hypothetical protein
VKFTQNYWEARENFQAAADRGGYRTLRFRIPHEESPDLFQDYALLKRDPHRFLIHICGVHGIEGYAGSAIQCALLEKTRPETGPSLLFIHAVNPLGMAFFRRANGENVDLNRNFRGGPAKPNPDYAFFSRYLNPSTRGDWWRGPLEAIWAKIRLGEERSGQAIASGQVTHPRGLFYMGREIQREIHLIQEFLKAHVASAKEITCLDFHTGLGNGEMLIVDRAQRERDLPYFQPLFGQIWVPDPASKLYENQGRFSDSVRSALPNGNVHYLLQEIGTHGPTKTLGALRAENWEWFRRKPGDPRPAKIQKAMLEAFCPGSAEWRQQTMKLGVERYETLLQTFEQG